MPKKKLKDTKVGKFLIGKGSLLSALGDSIPDKGLLGLVKNLVTEDKVLTPEDKETALKLLEMDKEEIEGVTRRWESDMASDVKLAKLARPLIILYLYLYYNTRCADRTYFIVRDYNYCIYHMHTYNTQYQNIQYYCIFILILYYIPV